MLVITSLYAAALAIVFLVLMVGVIHMRATTGIGFTDGGNVTLQQRDRRYANFVETVPLALVLLTLVELSGAGDLLLNIIGGLLLVGRIVHPFGMDRERPAHPMRIAGTLATQASVLVAAGALLVAALPGVL